MTSFEGKVVFITGAARGQGRSHAVRFAEAGADVIAVDICEQMSSVPYAMPTMEDLEETARLVAEQGRRAVTYKADVRSREDLESAVSSGLAELGQIDVVIANAGILPIPAPDIDEIDQWNDAIAVTLSGTWHTIKATIPSIIDRGAGGCILIAGSTSGLRGVSDGHGGIDGYSTAKFGLAGLVQNYANLLAQHSIRVNLVHPTGVATPMVINDQAAVWMADSSYPPNALPVQALESDDISKVMVWLASDEARYITGVSLPVDAGWAVNTMAQPLVP